MFRVVGLYGKNAKKNRESRRKGQFELIFPKAIQPSRHKQKQPAEATAQPEVLPTTEEVVAEVQVEVKVEINEENGAQSIKETTVVEVVAPAEIDNAALVACM